MSMIAITGGTGFVGGHLIAQAIAAGHTVRALTRRPQAARTGVAWVEGDLADAGALATLVAGADATIHVAGVINGVDRAAFVAGNVTGTEAMLAAARQAGCKRFVHISSLAAREPGLSDYGWSKAASERSVAASTLDTTIVRPPAIYGAGDRELLELFRMAARGVVLLPPGGRFSVIAVQDLCALLLALIDHDVRATIEPDDGVIAGWDHRDFARALGVAVGRRVLPVAVPRAVLRAAAAVDGLIRGAEAKLTPDRVRYFCHPDWVARARPAADLWRPEIATPDGLAVTAAAYRAAGWLQPG